MMQEEQENIDDIGEDTGQEQEDISEATPEGDSEVHPVQEAHRTIKKKFETPETEKSQSIWEPPVLPPKAIECHGIAPRWVCDRVIVSLGRAAFVEFCPSHRQRISVDAQLIVLKSLDNIWIIRTRSRCVTSRTHLTWEHTALKCMMFVGDTPANKCGRSVDVREIQ